MRKPPISSLTQLLSICAFLLLNACTIKMPSPELPSPQGNTSETPGDTTDEADPSPGEIEDPLPDPKLGIQKLFAAYPWNFENSEVYQSLKQDGYSLDLNVKELNSFNAWMEQDAYSSAEVKGNVEKQLVHIVDQLQGTHTAFRRFILDRRSYVSAPTNLSIPSSDPFLVHIDKAGSRSEIDSFLYLIGVLWRLSTSKTVLLYPKWIKSITINDSLAERAIEESAKFWDENSATMGPLLGSHSEQIHLVELNSYSAETQPPFKLFPSQKMLLINESTFSSDFLDELQGLLSKVKEIVKRQPSLEVDLTVPVTHSWRHPKALFEYQHLLNSIDHFLMQREKILEKLQVKKLEFVLCKAEFDQKPICGSYDARSQTLVWPLAFRRDPESPHVVVTREDIRRTLQKILR
ncbi:hypothetical protein GW916_02780 [bacterium]|nr:hypothetical protein [bacterium]